jgi:ABC-2 type transport system permease protein
MYLFPSSRTRDAIWVLSSVAMAGIYVLIRFSEPERLANPQELQQVIQYLNFLQAPTAPYLPSWWMTQALISFTAGASDAAAGGKIAWQAFKIIGGAVAAYALIILAAGRLYAEGYSGAQEGVRNRRPSVVEETWEEKLAHRLGFRGPVVELLWKDRKLLQRDVRYWSQLLLILALVAVYLFSIVKLPIDTPDLKSLVCFFNIATSGFVLTALGLRFTFPAVSLEGKQFWAVKGSPLSTRQLLKEKFLFSFVPLTGLGLVLVTASNYLLKADFFVATLSTATILLNCVTLVGMGVGFGAMFPKFNVENVHQIESSAGGFVYMATALGYVGATLAIEAIPVKMHFVQKFGGVDAWDWPILGMAVAMLALLNIGAFLIPWKLGERALEAHES